MNKLLKLAVLALCALTLASWSHGQGYNVFNVGDYQSTAQRSDAANWTCAVDQTSAINAAVAAANAAPGAVLYFPPGNYCTPTCGFVLTAPGITVEGVGSSSQDLLAGVSQITCQSTSAVLFTVNGKVGLFRDIALAQTGGTATSTSSAIRVTSSYLSQRVSYDNIMTSGFYDTIDIRVGEAWYLKNSLIQDSVHWGVRVQNIVNNDAGDWTIADNVFFPKGGADAAIKVESSGGGRIINNKVVPNSGLITNGIHLDGTGVSTVQLLISSNNIEGVNGAGIFLDAAWPNITVVGNYINAGSGVAPAITVVGGQFEIISNNILAGNNAAAISLTTTSNLTIGPNQIMNFGTLVSGGAATLTIDLSQLSFTVATLPSASLVRPGTTAYVTDANSSTFNATAVGGGSNKQKVVSDGTIWKIM